MIRADDINAVLRNNDIRQEIFNNFQITLQLDQRYELISLIFADKLYDRRSSHDNRIGFSVQELMDEAFRFWAKGFPASNKREVFHALLDELAGLGILIEDPSSGRYQLASPIIASMIGTAEEVEHRLLAFENEALPPEISPERRRMPLGTGEKWPRLSPLVPAQAQAILAPRSAKGVTERSRFAVVFGTRAMGLYRVTEALQQAAAGDSEIADVRKLRPHTDRNRFLREISAARDDQRLCIVVPADTPWTTDWLRETVELKNKTKFVFTGDGAHAWQCHVDDPSGIGLGRTVSVETLAPLSAVEIEDQLRRNLSSTESQRMVAERLYLAMGGFLTPFETLLKGDFPRMLDRFGEAELDPADFGVPAINAARGALTALLSYLSPNEDVRISDLQSLEGETGVDGLLLGNWLLAVGLAEPGMWIPQSPDESATLRLNPILRHRSVLCGLSVAG